MVNILPAILEPNKVEFESQLKKIFGLVDRVQVDIIDGEFVAPATVTPEDLGDIDTVIKFDYHLMVNEPIEWLDRCQTPQALGVYGHIEQMSDPSAFIAKAQVAGFEAGLALDIATPVDRIKDYVWDLDGLILLSVKAGAQGQEFDERVLPKIEHARNLRSDLPLIIDGGLDIDQIKRCIAAEWAQEMGEDELRRNLLDINFAVGSNLFEADNIKQKLEALEHLSQ